MDSSSPGNEDELAAPFKMKGLTHRRRFVRVDKDEYGNEVKVYELEDDDEWPTCFPVDDRGRKI